MTRYESRTGSRTDEQFGLLLQTMLGIEAFAIEAFELSNLCRGDFTESQL